MLVQDQMTGYISEVPDHLYGYEGYYGEYPDHVGESQVLYDGLGNPVGIFPAIASLAKTLLPAVGNIVGNLPGVGNILSKLPGVGQIFGGGGAPGSPGMLRPPIPFPPGLPGPFGSPTPPGFVPLPPHLGGGRPRYFNLRCVGWPRRHGLAPASAAGMAPMALPPPGTPVAAAQAAAAAAGASMNAEITFTSPVER